MADTLTYDFLPWARRGLARAHAAQAALGQPVMPTVSVGLTVSGDDAPQNAPPVPLKMLGPGDVTGIDPRVVVRTEPRPPARNFEPNYLAAVEFDAPDFPWLMTPARADANQRLAPWLVLVVLRRDEIAGPPQLRPGRKLPSVVLRGDAPVPLPDLAESWMWAHTQLVRQGGETVDRVLRNVPDRNLSRLICPRRLEPGHDYHACVVPAFDAGVKAGLGQPVAAGDVLGPAWAGAQATGIELPVYYSWEFSTGPAGDFETLARRLKTPPELDAATRARVAALGRVPVEVDADRLLQRGVVTPDVVQANYVARYEGALLSLSPNPPAEPGRAADIAALLRTVLTAGDLRALGNLAIEPDPEVPLVGPPSYGVWHARRHDLDPTHLERWLEGLNLSVPNRMAAGVGTRLVQVNQEEFMQAAWTQLGDILKTDRLLSRLHLSARALERLVARVALLPPPRQLQFLSPAAGRLKPGVARGGGDLTLWGYTRTTSLPDAAFDGSVRRGFSPVRAFVRHAESPAARGAAASLVTTFGDVAGARALLSTERFRVDGIAELRALDQLQLPADDAAQVEIPGFVVPITAGEARALLGASAGARAAIQPGAWRSVSVSRKLRGGVLLDSHWTRMSQFASTLSAAEIAAAPARQGAVTTVTPVTSMARAVLDVKGTKPEGVLLSAVREDAGVRLAPAQALWVDARSGSLALGRSVLGPRQLAARALAAALRPGQVATVDVGAIRRLGNTALFNTLPVGAVSAPVANRPPDAVFVPTATGGFRAGVPNVEVPPQPPNVGDRATVTLLPPDRREAVLDAYARAWHDKLVREAAPKLPPRVSTDVVPFAVDAAARGAVQAIDVATLVPRRVGSLVEIGGARLDLLAPAGAVGRAHLGFEQYVLAPLLDRVMAYPRIDEALYRRLVDMDRSSFMPGVEDIPNDTIMLVATNPRFVESFLVGANHEMNREFLWRGLPTDQRGTPFQKFWPYFDPATRDIQPIHLWNQSDPIGGAGGTGQSKPRLALLIRGALLARYPNTNVYAIEKREGFPPAFSGFMDIAGVPVPVPSVHPLGSGLLPPDVTFYLFDIDPGDAAAYWWVLEEPMTEPRFGFDDQEQPREVPRLRKRGAGAGRVTQYATIAFGINELLGASAGETWLDVDWSELNPPAAPGSHVRLAQLTSVQLATPSLQLTATAHAAQVAQAMLQRPFRGYFAGARLTG